MQKSHTTAYHRDIRVSQKALELRATLPAELANRYHPESFYEDLPVFMFAANLSIMRAGASILGELPAANLPAILIPGLYAGGHQQANATVGLLTKVVH